MMSWSIFFISVAQCLSYIGLFLILTIFPLVGMSLAPREGLSTVPLGMIQLGIVFGSILASKYIQNVGYYFSFQTSAFLYVVSSIFFALALFLESFFILLSGCLFFGIGFALVSFFRYSAAEMVSDKDQSKAVAYVLCGTVVAGLLAPVLTRVSRGVMDIDWMFSVILIGVLGFSLLFVNLFIDYQNNSGAKNNNGSKKNASRYIKTSSIFRYRLFIIAVTATIVGYILMKILMVGAVLEMANLSISFSDTVMAMQLHFLGMYVPSFFSAYCIDRFGIQRMIYIGYFLYLASVVFGLYSQSEWSFFMLLFLNGVGWNFLYMSSTALIMKVKNEGLAWRMRGVNEIANSVSQMIGTTLTGAVFVLVAWGSIMWALVLILAISIFVTFYFRLPLKRAFI